jgi:hypothetical protein
MADKPILITKADGTPEPFDIQKLEHSLRRAKLGPVMIKKVTDHILQELEEGMTTHEIYHHAFQVLHKLEKGVAFRYSLRRAVMELGPSGFPFEKFVSEIFKFKGYKILTDQVVNGFCVEHEIDVVAWKPVPADAVAGELIMVEAKFHNQPGLKSDLKVVLYVKSRFEDLSKSSFLYDGSEYVLRDGWLVTNTKFTTAAIKYAECQHMKVVGWNYPLDGNLHDLIEEAGLHPLTCLRSLSDHDKKTLLGQGIVLCKSLIEADTLLQSIGLAEDNIQAVKDEIRHIYATAAAPVTD